MTNLYLLRHGKVEGEPALYGHTDIKVSASANAEILADLLAVKHHFSSIVSSPLSRCLELGELFASQTDLPLHVDPALQEKSFGDVDGLAFASIKKQWPMLEKFWQNPGNNPLPNSETLEQFQQRISSILPLMLDKYQDESVLVICHGGVIRMLLSTVLELDWKNPSLFSKMKIDNASITAIKHEQSSNFTQVCGINLPISALHKNVATNINNVNINDD